MRGIIDTHSHILPGLDDGASDMRESMWMLRQAQNQGIAGVIATPHYSGRYQNVCPDRIRSLCREVQEQTRAELKKEIRIWPGQEIMYSEEVVSLLEEGKLLTIADSRYVLVEFMPVMPYSYIFRAVKEMTLAGYRPILAHAERYPALREAGRVKELKEQGACVQLNFRPIGGKWYYDTTKWCRKMLRERNVDFLGTDMHNSEGRRPEIEKGAKWLKKSLASDYIKKLLNENALKMLKDKEL